MLTKLALAQTAAVDITARWPEELKGMATAKAAKLIEPILKQLHLDLDKPAPFNGTPDAKKFSGFLWSVKVPGTPDGVTVGISFLGRKSNQRGGNGQVTVSASISVVKDGEYVNGPWSWSACLTPQYLPEMLTKVKFKD